IRADDLAGACAPLHHVGLCTMTDLRRRARPSALRVVSELPSSTSGAEHDHEGSLVLPRVIGEVRFPCNGLLLGRRARTPRTSASPERTPGENESPDALRDVSRAFTDHFTDHTA